MLEFNNNHIFTGYIKQLLASFNLPTFRIYTKENEKYFDAHNEEKDIIETILLTSTLKDDPNDHKFIYNDHVRYVPYIKNDLIQEYIVDCDQSGNIGNGRWITKGLNFAKKSVNVFSHLHHYEYNMYIPNYTRHLEIKNNIYDSYTHEYLGNYLRFKRDYSGLDLMPLYNCFSNRLCTNCDIKIKDIKELQETEKEKFDDYTTVSSFNATDTRYKIYMLPVKLFKDYTIAIDSDAPVELCCAVYGKYQDSRHKFQTIPTLTYQRFGTMYFGQPIVYTKLSEIKKLLNSLSATSDSISNITTKNIIQTELAQNEGDLKLFIKVPFNNKSTITILEGNYIGWGDSIFDASGEVRDVPVDKDEPLGLTKKQVFSTPAKFYINHTITNFEGAIDPLDINKRVGITEDDDFNLITTLQLLKFNTGISYPFADRLIEYLTGNAITNEDYIADNIERLQKVIGMNGLDSKPTYKSKFTGTWENLYRPVLYSYINDPTNVDTWNSTINHDIFGYVDKDVEKLYTRTDSNNEAYTIANIDIYPDIYKDDK